MSLTAKLAKTVGSVHFFQVSNYSVADILSQLISTNIYWIHRLFGKYAKKKKKTYSSKKQMPKWESPHKTV